MNNLVFLILISSIILFGILNVSHAQDDLSGSSTIPDWVRDVASWWGQGLISDDDFIGGLQYLIDNGVLQFSEVNQDYEILVNSLEMENDKLNNENSALNLENWQLNAENRQLLASVKNLQTQLVNVQDFPDTFQDLGNFHVYYEPTNDAYFIELETHFTESEYIDLITDALNDSLILPYDVSIFLAECGFENAYYDYEFKEIVICYELIEYFVDLFSDIAESDEELRIQIEDVVYFVLLHELGHALIDVYDLPITGMEEDAVDQLSTIILLSEGQPGLDALASVAGWFLYEGLLDVFNDELYFWGVHSLDLQRFYNILCLAYGENPNENYHLVESGYLPEERADSCPFEYERVSNSWNILLQPYLK